MTSSTDDFFEEPLEQSRVKGRIVSDYVITFTRILSDHLRRAGKSPLVEYVDLFSGPGSYDDGTASTPLLIIREAIRDDKLSSSLKIYFNDHDEEKANSLRRELDTLAGIEKLTYAPLVFNKEASVQFVESLHLKPETPKLFFLDPFGYKKLTIPLLRSALTGWAECIFFFNYRRVIAALNNPVFDELVGRLFGESRITALKNEISKTQSVQEREAIVLRHLNSALIDAGAKHVMNFSFKVEDSHRSTHHLVFATRHRKGYEAMKTIMARESTAETEDGPSMTFTQRPSEPTLFDRDPHEVLAETLLERFQSRTASLDQIYAEFGSETLYTLPYFRQSLLLLEKNGKVKVQPVAASRPAPKGKQSMSGNTIIIFPEVPS